MKLRKQTYVLDQYLKLMQKEVIRSDQECQRLAGQWNSNMVNELIYTVLTDGYIPPVILGEETKNEIERRWIIDGLQRSTSLSLFRYGNTRITKNLDEYLVTYQRKVLDESGNVKRDSQGEIVWESVQYDIRNKTYAQLPEELQDRFNEYQIETAIHQDCDMMEISKLVRRFNNHRAMNTNQRAFTYLDNFASDLRRVTENRFFLDIFSGSSKGKINGLFERIVADMVIMCNYPDSYRKNSKANFEWLNENASIYDFESLNGLLTRLTDSLEITAEIKELFSVKNAHIVIAAFKAFTETGKPDKEFKGFLEWFVNDGSKTEVDGKTWNDWNLNRASRDTSVVFGKYSYLMEIVKQYTTENLKVA